MGFLEWLSTADTPSKKPLSGPAFAVSSPSFANISELVRYTAETEPVGLLQRQGAEGGPARFLDCWLKTFGLQNALHPGEEPALTATLPANRAIRVSPALQSELCHLAFTTFTSKPGEGVALEGPLFGAAGADAVEVTGFGQSGENRRNVVGHWRVDRRLNQPHPFSTPGVCLVVAPVTVQMAEAILWERTTDGIDSPARRETFRGETRVPKRITPPLQPAIGAADANRRDWRPVASLLAVLLLTAVGFWQWPVSTTETPDPPRLLLTVQSADRDLRVQWRESGGTGRVESAVLMVRAGRDELAIDLMDQYQPKGEILVHSPGHEVVVNLRVRRQGQPVAAHTVTYVEPQLAQNASPGGELEWLRWRTLELETELARYRN